MSFDAGRNCLPIKRWDTCWEIAISCGIDLDALYKINPSLIGGQACDNLRIGDAIGCQAARNAIEENWNTGDGNVKWQFNCDYYGHDLERLPSSGENCGGLCVAHPKCTHFRYTDDGYCYLKTLPLTSRRTPAKGGVCGYLPFKFGNFSFPIYFNVNDQSLQYNLPSCTRITASGRLEFRRGWCQVASQLRFLRQRHRANRGYRRVMRRPVRCQS